MYRLYVCIRLKDGARYVVSARRHGRVLCSLGPSPLALASCSRLLLSPPAVASRSRLLLSPPALASCCRLLPSPPALAPCTQPLRLSLAAPHLSLALRRAPASQSEGRKGQEAGEAGKARHKAANARLKQGYSKRQKCNPKPPEAKMQTQASRACSASRTSRTPNHNSKPKTQNHKL